MTAIPTYSVIIPIYKAEATLCRCVDSLLCQKREDAEIILVNDGSPDGSAAICRQYAAEHPCIVYIDKENGGVSTARNAGLDAAKGEYVTFVDSDDYVTEDYFAVLDDASKEADWDLVYFSNYRTDGKTVAERRRTPFCARKRDTALPWIIDAICRKNLNAPWAKLYRRSIIEKYGIRFPVGASVAEDRAFNISYALRIQSVCVLEKPIYYVSTENADSLSRRRHDDLDRQFAITGKYVRDAIAAAEIPENEKRQFSSALDFGICRGVYKDAKDLHRDHIPLLRRWKEIRRLCRDINRNNYTYPHTRYCRLISLPVRWNLVPVIDAMAWKLTH